LLEKLDKIYTDCPFYGSRRMREILKRKGYSVNRKRVTRLMKILGIKAIYPKKNLSKSNSEHKKFPYLLKDMEINKPNQVWATDITYIPIKGGFFYLTVIMDWHTRYILKYLIQIKGCNTHQKNLQKF
jgi:putative transposase